MCIVDILGLVLKCRDMIGYGEGNCSPFFMLMRMPMVGELGHFITQTSITYTQQAMHVGLAAISVCQS